MGLENFIFHPLDIRGDILPFHCKDDDLNDFLLEDSRKYQIDLLTVTYLIEDVVKRITIAYFSVLNDKIVFDPKQKSFWNKINRNISNSKRRKTYPSVKIARLAISEEYVGLGIGREIIRLIKYMFANGNKTGCRSITVDAYSDVVGFYQKCGFNFISEKDKNDKTRLMYYDIKSSLP